MSTSNNNKGEFLMTRFEILGSWAARHAKIIMPIVLAVCVIVTVVISVNANKREAQKQEDVAANSPLEEMTGDTAKVPEVELKENDNPQITELINAYYAAQVDGNTDAVLELLDGIDDTAIMRIQEMSKYIESYPTIDIYTKVGAKENTYVVYVDSLLKFADYDKPVPGLATYYVCQREDGSYYISFNQEGDKNELDYIREVSLQDDAVDLNNKVAAAYNNLLAENPELAQIILDVKEEIEKNIGEALAQAEAENEAASANQNPEADAETGDAPAPETITVVTKVKATDVVNIRSSDSETADKLGKAALGEEFDLIEKIENGWSKVAYEGGEAFIKSEYLEDIETTEVAVNDNVDAAAGDNNQNGASTDAPQQTADITTTGTVTVIDNVRIRSGASEDSEKLATAYVGEKLELVMKQADGWTKIKYNGKIAYVKSDYVE